MKHLAKCCVMVISILAICVGFQSCGGDDDDNPKNPSIVGTWTHTETEYEDGLTYTYVDRLVFNSNGTGYNTETVTVSIRAAQSFEYRMDFLWKEEKSADNVRYVEIIKTSGDDLIDSSRFTFSLIGEKLNIFGVVYNKI